MDMTDTSRDPVPHGSRVLENLSEMLLTHYVGGAWRAPHGAGRFPLLDADGHLIGKVVLGDAQDMARARRAARAGTGASHGARSVARAALAKGGAALAHALATPPPGRTPDATRLRVIDPPAGGDAVVLVGDVTQGVALFADLLDRVLDQGQGMIVLSDPAAAIGASILIDALHRAGLPAGSIALLHADPAGAEVLARCR